MQKQSWLRVTDEFVAHRVHGIGNSSVITLTRWVGMPKLLFIGVKK